MITSAVQDSTKNIRKVSLLTFLFVYLAWLLIIFYFTGGFHGPIDWALSWGQWDSHLYEKIWINGYSTNEPNLFAFPPGNSIVTGFIAKLFGIPFSLAGLVLNVILFFLWAQMSSKILSRIFNFPPIALFLMILSSPPVYFALTPYSDSLFSLIFWTAISLASLNIYTHQQRVYEFLLLLFAPWIRLTGYAFVSWIFFKRKSTVAVLASGIGWLIFNYLITGNALFFLEVQKQFIIAEGNIFDGIQVVFNGLFSLDTSSFNKGELDQFLQSYILPAVYFVSFIAVSGWYFYKKQNLLAVTILAVLFLSHNQSFWRSAVRYNLPLFPFLYAFFLYYFYKIQKNFLKILIGLAIVMIWVTQFEFQVYFANLFKNGYWGF